MTPTLDTTSASSRSHKDRAGWLVIVGLFLLAVQLPFPHTAAAQDLTTGSYFWYVPEHEQQGRTAFYWQPNFNSRTVRVTRGQRFKVLGTQRGWALIEFDYAGKAYVHLRIIRIAMYDPTASDPWYEFQRASIFNDSPDKVEARLKGTREPATQATDSKTPAWKRYKDGWNLKPSRPMPVITEGDDSTASTAAAPSRPGFEKKPRSKYSLLPPIGSEPPPQDATASGQSPSDDAQKPSP